MTEQSQIPDFIGSQKRTKPSSSATLKTFFLSVVLIGGLISVLWFVYRNKLKPSIPVKTHQVLLFASEATGAVKPSAAVSELQFQASGWVEPDPWQVNVAVLTDGFVEEVLVNEGDTVTNGQIIAKLDAADAKLAQRASRADEAAAKAAYETAMDSWTRIKALPEQDTTPNERVRAKSELDLRKAQLDAAHVKREIADLSLARTIIRSNQDGVVLRRFVEPGSKRMVRMDDPHSAVIVSLFNPDELQVRVDVPLSEAGRLRIGQPTRIMTAMLPGITHTGYVSRIIGQADLQRNTLQAKVRINDPDKRLRPEVLCRVEFWSAQSDSIGVRDKSGNLTMQNLWILEDALEDPSTSEQEVWVIDSINQTAHRRLIQLGSATRDGYRIVKDGLLANEIVVLSAGKPLTEGCRVRNDEKEAAE